MTFTFVILSWTVLLGPADVPDDEWPRYGRDGALTGRTLLKGDLENPRPAWSISLAGEELDLELRPEPGRRALRIPGDLETVKPRALQLPGPALRDLDGSGILRPAAETYHERWAEILPGQKGLQRIAWDNTWTTAKICHLELFAYDQGWDRPRRVWQSPAEDVVFSPLNVVYDIDGDGVQEICVALHYRVMIFEGTTGRKETELRFHSSRSYGWFGLADVDADEQMELVILSDFQSHLDVLEFDPARPEAERLSVKWRRDIEQNIEDRGRWPQVGPRPLADVTGDGKPEIILNLFNDSGDGEWHVAIIEAATGKTLFHLPGRYTQGNADLDGDGISEIFCVATDGIFVPARGTVEILRLKEGKPDILWSRSSAGFGLADLPRMGSLWATTASGGMRHVLVTEGERPAFLVLYCSPGKSAEQPEATHESSSLMALRWDGQGGFSTLWSLHGIPGMLEMVALSGTGAVSALIRLVLPAGSRGLLECEGAAPFLVGRERKGTAPFSPAAARIQREGPVHVVVEGTGEMVFAIRPPKHGVGGPDLVWRRPGRGGSDGSRQCSVVLSDLDGDGGAEVLAAQETSTGSAALVAYRGNGDIYWKRVFPRTPGALPIWNVGALTFWWPGRYRAGERIELFVSTRRGLMHSDVGHLLDGRSGKSIWRRERAEVPGQFRWGYAGSAVAAADVLGDGRDELVNLYPVCFWIADGSNGEILSARELASRKQLPAWAAYGEPLVYDFNGDGRREILLDSIYVLALLDLEGNPIWHGKGRRDYLTGSPDDNTGETTGTKHALVDFDGDGKPELASAGYGDGVRAVDPRDGKILWTLASASPSVRKCAAADIDGNGGEELIYTAGDTLLAITGSRSGGRLLWEWKGPAVLSLPAIADLDGDGRAEIAVQSADGVVHCLDNP